MDYRHDIWSYWTHSQPLVQLSDGRREDFRLADGPEAASIVPTVKLFPCWKGGIHKNGIRYDSLSSMEELLSKD